MRRNEDWHDGRNQRRKKIRLRQTDTGLKHLVRRLARHLARHLVRQLVGGDFGQGASCIYKAEAIHAQEAEAAEQQEGVQNTPEMPRIQEVR